MISSLGSRARSGRIAAVLSGILLYTLLLTGCSQAQSEDEQAPLATAALAATVEEVSVIANTETPTATLRPTNTLVPATNTPVPPPTSPPPPPTNTPAPLPTTPPQQPPPPVAGCVDINHAGYEDLQRITHIGPERAEEIIRLRAQRRFSSVDDLARVNGIGPARIRDIKAQGLACVSPP